MSELKKKKTFTFDLMNLNGVLFSKKMIPEHLRISSVN